MGNLIETLLRPPVEFWSALTAAGCAAIAIMSPPLLLMTPPVAYSTAAGLLIMALWRFWQGWQIVRYQQALVRLPDYRLTADQIPWSQTHLFLGKGFRWTPRHTQRLAETQTEDGRPYVEPSRAYEWIRAMEIRWEKYRLLRPLAKITSANSRINPFRPLPPVGGKPELHGVGALEERDVWTHLKEREGNTLVLGAPGSGKSRLAEILITQDIHRGDCTIVFDPKGDPDLMRRVIAEARRASKEDRLYVFHLGFPEISARYNPVGDYERITEVATRTTNPLPSEGNSAAFREYSWLSVNIAAKALQALGRTIDYPTIYQNVIDLEPLFQDYCANWLGQAAPDWETAVTALENTITPRNVPPHMRDRKTRTIALVRYIKEHHLQDPIAMGLMALVEHDKSHYDKLVIQLRPLLEKLITGPLARLIAPDHHDTEDPRPVFDWVQVIRRGGIVYVGLDAMADIAVAQAVGSAMFADLTSVAARIYKHGIDQGLPGASRDRKPAVSIHADEFNDIIGREFVPLVNKARGAGFTVTAYTQTWSDIEVRMGGPAHAGQIEGNFQNLIMLRPRQLATAELLTSRLETVHIKTKVPMSSSTPAAGEDRDFTPTNMDRIVPEKVPLIQPADAMALPKGQAFALLEGGRLWKLRLPLPDSSNDPAMPKDLDTAIDQMRKKYISTDLWWQETA